MQEEQKELTELEELQKKCDEYLNNWKRAAADFANYKKDEMERAGLLMGYAKEDVLHKILPIFDSFYLSQQHTNKLENVGMTEWMKGFLQIQKQIEGFLKKEGIEEIETLGKPFDHNTMEAVGEADGADQMESGMVVEELQKGYAVGDKILRPAKVKISK